MIVCTDCGGSGVSGYTDKRISCSGCGGTGADLSSDGPPIDSCKSCGGYGYEVVKEPVTCGGCGGSGSV